MVKTEALKTRASQVATAKKKLYTRSPKPVAKYQISHSMKRATATLAPRRATTNHSSSSRRGKERWLTAERTEPDLSGPGVPPNLDALATTLGHMYAKSRGRIAIAFGPLQDPEASKDSTEVKLKASKTLKILQRRAFEAKASSTTTTRGISHETRPSSAGGLEDKTVLLPS